MSPEQEVLEALADMSQMDYVREWAKIERALKSFREQALASLGHTEESRKEVMANAIVQMGEAFDIETEHGLVQRIPDKPVQYRIRKSVHDTDPVIQQQRLRLITREV